MTTTTSTVATDVIERVVSSIVQETLLQESVMIPSIMNMSAMIRPGMDTLKIPRFTALPVETVTEGTSLTINNPTIATDDLVMEINQAIHWEISDRADIQSKIDIAVQLVRDGSRTLAFQIDDNIITRLNTVSTATPDNLLAFANATNIQLTDIAAARERLNEQNVPMSDRFIAIPPKQERFILAIEEIIHLEKYGTTDAIQNGEIGKIFGFKILLTTSANLNDDSFLAYHRSAVAYGTQISPKFETDRNVAKLVDEYTLSQLYGVQLLDNTGTGGGVRNVLTTPTGM